ncbi:inositol 2-dehydrogenase [Pelagibius sp. Alg239-R121]|uniref:inositol 2-dehydrogenase n=1 Tax=Pelagibius sp. Alg239-R121 TaxID=2993448 RepID=UPI0024A65D72|nr:inositol 2-dehydrogenase [Pelagibius sp. Alg239-R121]
MLNFCQFGAGRIGSIHAENIARHGAAKLRYVVDVNTTAAQALAQKHGAEVVSIEVALADPLVGAVVIASSTDTHADLIEASARAGKAIFCEKPIDLTLERVESCLAVAKGAGVPLALAFNRRFDPSFAELQRRLVERAIGDVEIISITSRDPAPPPVAYIKVSGGLFRDMMIHDFDVARWLLGEEPVEITATASCLVDPAIADAGDVDSALVTLRTESGRLCQISNSRRAAYGYDQRIEVHGSKGMLRAENQLPTTLEIATESGVSHDKPLYFFLERYAAAYRAELEAFIDAVTAAEAPSPCGEDGRRALVLADAALQSLREGRTVKLAP